MLANLGRQWQLDQNAVNFVVVIELGDQLQQFFFGRRGAQSMQPAFDPHPLAGRTLILHINRAGRIFADENRGERRLLPVVLQEIGNLFGQFAFDLGGECFAVEDGGGQASDPLVS